MRQSTATLAVVIASVFWGSTGTIAYFIGDSLDPFTIGAGTLGIGGVVLALLAGPRALQLWRHRHQRPWLILGAVAVVIYPLAFYTGMDLAGVAVGNIVAIGLGPLVGAAWEWRVDRQRPGHTWWWAMAAGAGGVLLLSTSSHEQSAADPDNWGFGLIAAIVAGLCYGTYSYAMARVIRSGHTPLETSGAVFGASAVPLLLLLALQSGQLQSAGSDLYGLVYLIAGPMVISYLLYTRAMRTLLSSAVLLISLVEPAVATALAVAVVGERFDLQGALGMVSIVLAVVLAGRRSRPTEPAQTS